MIGRLPHMPLGPMLSPRGAPFAGWLTACFLFMLPLIAVAACTDSVPQDDQPQAQRQQQSNAQQDQSAEPDASQTAADEQQVDADQHGATVDSQQGDESQSSAADAMQRDRQESQQQTQSYGSADPYGDGEDGDDSAQDDQPVTPPVPPVRQWLAEGVALAPSVPAEGDEYGWSAVIEGDIIAIGAPYHDELGEDTGAVFIFERIDGEWIETAYLLPPFPDPLGWFGRWLAIDEGRIVIGAPYEDGLREDGSRIDDSGVAYVYEKVNGEWTRTGTLLPQTPYSGASFGWSVAISGERIAVSAWEAPLFGMQTGSVTIFTQHKGLWRAEAVLQPAEASERMMFGRDIELQGDVLAVGAPGDDTIAEDAGAVYVWHYYNDEWNFAGRLVAADGIAHDRLGS
ncbi:MAG: hypothetical protein F4X58_06005, partial [Chloroflexi bacterium]|nr:hypothetical protein [Chloroflexota bacterium]